MADRFDAFGQRIYPAKKALAALVVDEGKWHDFEPVKAFPEPLRTATQMVSDAVGAVTKAGKLTEKALNIASKFATKASVNPAETALRTVLANIDKFVQGIEYKARCHAIMIPIRKQTIRVGPDASSVFDAFLNPEEPAFAYVNNMRTAQGGTQVFFRTLVESVNDGGDINRPQFPPDYAVAGVCLIAGAETLRDLQVPLRLFAMLFGDQHRIPPAANTIPVVQNLRVTPAAVSGGTGVVVRWDPLPVRSNLVLHTNDTIFASEIFIIRSTEPISAASWDVLFPGVTVSEDRSNLPRNDQAEVIARIRNHGFVTSYTDTRNLMSSDHSYYFTACVRYGIGNGRFMGPLSGVVRAMRTNPAPISARGMAPDWVATPTFARLIPPLNRTINTVRLAISRLGSRTTSNSGAQQMLLQTVAQLQRLVAQWEMTAKEVETLTTQLNAITQTATPTGIYSTTITRGTGGIEGWLSELARRLSDVNDSSRPTFSSQSVVVGYVILAGAPRLPDLSPLIALLELLFGKHAKNPLLDVNRALDGNPAASPATSTSTTPAVLGYDAALKPSTTPTC